MQGGSGKSGGAFREWGRYMLHTLSVDFSVNFSVYPSCIFPVHAHVLNTQYSVSEKIF